MCIKLFSWVWNFSLFNIFLKITEPGSINVLKCSGFHKDDTWSLSFEHFAIAFYLLSHCFWDLWCSFTPSSSAGSWNGLNDLTISFSWFFNRGIMKFAKSGRHIDITDQEKRDKIQHWKKINEVVDFSLKRKTTHLNHWGYNRIS